jgi:hypothetical protein
MERLTRPEVDAFRGRAAIERFAYHSRPEQGDKKVLDLLGAVQGGAVFSQLMNEDAIVSPMVQLSGEHSAPIKKPHSGGQGNPRPSPVSISAGG